MAKPFSHFWFKRLHFKSILIPRSTMAKRQNSHHPYLAPRLAQQAPRKNFATASVAIQLQLGQRDRISIIKNVPVLCVGMVRRQRSSRETHGADRRRQLPAPWMSPSRNNSRKLHAPQGLRNVKGDFRREDHCERSFIQPAKAVRCSAIGCCLAHINSRRFPQTRFSISSAVSPGLLRM